MPKVDFESATVYYKESDVSQGSRVPARLTAVSGAGIDAAEFDEYNIDFPSQLLDKDYVKKAIEDGRGGGKKKINLMSMNGQDRDKFLEKVTWDESQF